MATKLKRRTGAARVISSTPKGATGDFRKMEKLADSGQLADPFVSSYGITIGPLGIIVPLYDYLSLQELYLKSDILRQCIDAYVTNIEAYGHVLEYVGPEGEESSTENQREHRVITSFLKHPSPDKTLSAIRKDSRIDLEMFGARAFEISRDRKGRIVLFDHVPITTIRVTRRETTPTLVTYMVHDPDAAGKFMKVKVNRYFRRFVQISLTGQWIFFKEFGDPRRIDPKNGQVNDELPFEDCATEILYDSLYTPGTVYGTPRWIGQIRSVLGTIESETVNLNFFRNNGIPAMVVLVSGGALTEEAFDNVQTMFTAVRGGDSMDRVLVLEAAADDHHGGVNDSPPAPKVDMKPMLSERQQDGLFQGYEKRNEEKVRSSFRLPPIHVGLSQDYSRATAISSMLMAEAQVFLPERQAFDDEIANRHLLQSYGITNWKFRTLGPAIVDPETCGRLIKALGEQGGLTPNIAIKIAKRVLDIDIKPILEPWGDYPFDAVLAFAGQGIAIDGLQDFVAEALPKLIDPNVDQGGPSSADPADAGDSPAKKPAKAPAKQGYPAQKPTPSRMTKEFRNIIREELRDMLEDMREASAVGPGIPASDGYVQ